MKNKNHNLIIAFLAIVLLLLSVSAAAHSGRTDSNGGHRDNSTGTYHYHHGYSAHYHYDMDGDGDIDCPYLFKDNTSNSSSNSNNSSNKNSTSSSSNSASSSTNNSNSQNNSQTSDKNSTAEKGGVGSVFVFIALILMVSAGVWIWFATINYSGKYLYPMSTDSYSMVKKIRTKIHSFPDIDSSDIQKNYLYLDEVCDSINQLRKLQEKNKENQQTNTKKYSDSLFWAFAIIYISMVILACIILSNTMLSDEQFVVVILSIVVSFVVYIFAVLPIYFKLLDFIENKNNEFSNNLNNHIQDITLELANQTQKYSENIYQFLGVPSRVILPKYNTNYRDPFNAPYGSITRYVSSNGKCFHKAIGCSNAYTPMNLYDIVCYRKNYTYCKKCANSDSCVALPEWYIYYLKFETIVKEIKT